MRRRVKEGRSGDPPAELLTFTGRTYAGWKTWQDTRMQWWDDHHQEHEPGDLAWMFAGVDVMPAPPPFCGGPMVWDGEIQGQRRRNGSWCGRADCLCREGVA